MSDQDQTESEGVEKVQVSRRRLLSAIALGGGAAAVLPERWIKPVVDAIVLPAHAQATVGQNFGMYSSQNGGNIQGQRSMPSGSFLDRMAGFLVGTAAASGLAGGCSHANTLPNTFCVSFDVPQAGANVEIAVYDSELDQFLTGWGNLVEINEIGDVLIGGDTPKDQAFFSNLAVHPDELTGFMVYPLENATARCYDLALPRTDGQPCTPTLNATAFFT